MLPTSPESPAGKPRVSLRDVAREAGVSHVTVSLALRQDPRISAERRASIAALAERLGYRPDPMLSSLAAYRQSRHPAAFRCLIGWLNQWADPKALAGFHEFAAYREGAEEMAEKLGYRIEEFVIGPELSPARLQHILLARGVRGVLVPPHLYGLSLPDFDWSPFSVLRFGASVKQPRAHIVTSDQTKCAAMAFARVWERGYRRIGFVTSLRYDRNTKGNFRAGYLSAQDAMAPVRNHLAPLFIDEEAAPSDARLLKGWIRAMKPDAVITSQGRLPELLQQIGIQVPRDLAAAALSIADGHFDSGVDQNAREIGRVAASTLAGLIHQYERGIPEYCRRILVEGRWVDGTSLPPKGGGASKEPHQYPGRPRSRRARASIK